MLAMDGRFFYLDRRVNDVGSVDARLSSCCAGHWVVYRVCPGHSCILPLVVWLDQRLFALIDDMNPTIGVLCARQMASVVSIFE